MSNVIWSQADDEKLTELYPNNSARQIAKTLGRTKAAIKNRIARLKLSKGGNDGCFPKGGVPWNKGTKFDSGGRSHETRFKPGHMPHTWNPIGHERESKEGYLQRKMTDTGVTRHDYVGIHHIVWRESGQEIPKGFALRFKDGNKRNFALDNLELISRRDLMLLNSVHNHGPEIAELTRLRARITRQINKQERLSP